MFQFQNFKNSFCLKNNCKQQHEENSNQNNDRHSQQHTHFLPRLLLVLLRLLNLLDALLRELRRLYGISLDRIHDKISTQTTPQIHSNTYSVSHLSFKLILIEKRI